MDVAVIGHGSGSLRFSDVSRSNDGEPNSLTVEIVDVGLRARSRIVGHYASGFNDLVGFFARMARDWRGRDGDLVHDPWSTI